MYQQGTTILTYPNLNYSVNFPVGFPSAPTLVNVDVRFSGDEEDQIPVSVIVNNITDTYFEFSLSNPIADLGSYATPAEAYMFGAGFVEYDAFSIGSEYYTLVSSVSGPFEVLLGASDAETRENIVDAINTNSTIVTAELLDSGTPGVFAKIIHVTPGVIGNSVTLPNMGPPDFSDSSGDRVTTMFGGTEDTPSGYTVMWQANDGVDTVAPAGPGYPVSNFPPFNKPNLPDSTVFPIVTNAAGLRSYSLTWSRLKSLLSSAHSHLISQISDITAIGARLLRSTTSAEARATIGASAELHTHTASNISDSSLVGREVLTAETPADARAATGSAAATHTHVTTDITDSTALGRNILKAASQASARALIDSPAVAHTHVVNDLSDSSVLGRNVIKADSATGVRDLINSLNGNGWDGTVVISASSGMLESAYGNIAYFDTTGITYTIPSNVSTIFRTGLFIPSGVNITLAVGSGAVNLLSEDLKNLGSNIPLVAGMYILECVGLNLFVLSRYKNTLNRTLSLAETVTEFKTALALSINDLTDVNVLVKNSFGGTTDEVVKSKLSILTPVNLNTPGAVNLSNLFASTVAGKLFRIQEPTDITIDSLGVDCLVGESFYVQNLLVNHTQIYVPTGIQVNGVNNTNIPIRVGEIIKVTKIGGTPGNEILATNAPTRQELVLPALYVSNDGNDLSAIKGDINRPWASIPAAALACGDYETIVVLPGSYRVNAGQYISTPNKVGVNMFIHQGAIIKNQGTKALFQDFEGPIDMVVRGYANFTYHHTGSNEGLINLTNADSTLDIEFESNTRGVTGTNGSVSNFPPVKVANLNNPIRVKANTFNNLVGGFPIVEANASTVNIEFNKANCGIHGFKMINGGIINASVINGYLHIGGNLFTSTESGLADRLNITLVNADVVQTNASYEFITLENPSTALRITGVNSSIYSLEDETDGLVLVNAGNIFINGVTLKGTITTNTDSVILDSVNLIVNPAFFGSCISSGAENSITIYRTCISNLSPDLDTINLKGGSFIWNEDFTQY